MVAAEVIALIALLFGGAAGLRAVWSWTRRSAERGEREERRHDQMQQDLRSALASRDYRLLDDFMVTWAAELNADDDARVVLEHVKRRRDELYVDSNP